MTDGLSDVSDIENSNQIITPDQPKVEEPFETKPSNIDSDGDGLTDEAEEKLGLDPNNIDTDGDGIIDLHDIPEQNKPNNGETPSPEQPNIGQSIDRMPNTDTPNASPPNQGTEQPNVGGLPNVGLPTGGIPTGVIPVDTKPVGGGNLVEDNQAAFNQVENRQAGVSLVEDSQVEDNQVVFNLVENRAVVENQVVACPKDLTKHSNPSPMPSEMRWATCQKNATNSQANGS